LGQVKKIVEFIPGKTYRIAYKSLSNSSDFDVEFSCPNCESNEWIYHDRTGTGKLPVSQMKWKCAKCGQYFICNTDAVTKILGL